MGSHFLLQGNLPDPGIESRSATLLGFPGSSDGKESTCNAGEPCSIPGSERSPGEGIGYPLQYSWASMVAQLVKNTPAMRETWFQSLGWEDPLEKGMATHSSILAWRIPWTEEPGGVTNTFNVDTQWNAKTVSFLNFRSPSPYSSRKLNNTVVQVNENLFTYFFICSR